MRRIPADRGEPTRRRQRQRQFPPARQFRSDFGVSDGANQPERADWVSKHRQQGKRHGSDPIDSPRPPENRQPEASQPQRQIIVHETHAERIAIGQHGDARRKKPRRPLRYRRNKRENSPEENQHASGNNNFLRRGKPHKIRHSQQRHIKQDVLPLLRDVQPRRLSLFN